MAMSLDASDNGVEMGNVSLFVDFGADVAKLIIYGNETNVLGDYQFQNMQIDGNQIVGGEIDHGTGGAKGAFYGPQGDFVGGNFQIMDEETMTNVKGVYEVEALAPSQE
jgi:hypothetical protein